LIAKNAGVNGSVVSEKVLANDNVKFGYNAATGKYEDLMAAGIIDPTKVSFSHTLPHSVLLSHLIAKYPMNLSGFLFSGCEMLLRTCRLSCKDVLDV
jgi:hypothetical protein